MGLSNVGLDDISIPCEEVGGEIALMHIAKASFIRVQGLVRRCDKPQA
jgi:hypothetical protein